MANERPDGRQPLSDWLPGVILRYLVLAVYAFVLYQATMGAGAEDLPTGRVWVIVVGLMGLLLLPVVDRLTALKVSSGGVEATLAEAKVQALQEVGEMEDREAARTATAEILKAQTARQVQAAKEVAVQLNATRIIERTTEAIRARLKCYVRYRPGVDEPVDNYLVAPLDVKPGKTEATGLNDYLWVHSYESGGTRSLRLDRVLRVDVTDETFDPAELMAGWRNKEPEWNVAREW